MNPSLKNILFRFLLVAILLSISYPTSTFAMDPKMEAKATKEIIGEFEECFKDQKTVLNNMQEPAERQKDRVIEAVTKSALFCSSSSFSEQGSITAAEQSSSSTDVTGKRKRGGEDNAAQISDEEDDLLGKGEVTLTKTGELLTDQTVQENILRLTNQIEAAKQASKEKRNGSNTDLWDFIVNTLEQSRDTWNKVSEAQEARKVSLAVGYREAAATLEHAVDQSKLAAENYTIGVRDKWSSWFMEGIALQAKADYQVKACKAEEVGKAMLVAACKEAAALSQYAADYYQWAAQAFAEESTHYWLLGTEKKESEGRSYCLLGEYLQFKAKYQVETAEMREEMESEKSAAKKDTRVFPKLASTKSKALFVCCEKWLVETKLAEGADKTLSDYVRNVVKRGADHRAVREFEKYWDHVAKAHELGDDPQALGWIQVAEDIQQIIEYSIKEQEDGTPLFNDLMEPNFLDYIFNETWELAKRKEKYIQAAVSSQSPEIVSWRKKIVEQSESIAAYNRKVAGVGSSCDKQELYNTPFNPFFGRNISNLEEAVNGLERSLLNSAPSEISARWRRAAEQYQLYVELFLKAVEEHAKAEVLNNISNVTEENQEALIYPWEIDSVFPNGTEETLRLEKAANAAYAAAEVAGIEAELISQKIKQG